MKDERGERREERGEMKEERGEMKINYVIPPSLIRRGMESLTAYSECRDAIPHFIRWHDAPVTGFLEICAD